MQVAWSPGCFSGPNALPPPARAALEGAARRAAAAFAGEAAASGGAYGREAQVCAAACMLPEWAMLEVCCAGVPIVLAL